MAARFCLFPAQRERSCLDGREAQEIVDECFHARDVAVKAFEACAESRALRNLLRQEKNLQLHAGERGPQFVRDHADERVLRRCFRHIAPHPCELDVCVDPRAQFAAEEWLDDEVVGSAAEPLSVASSPVRAVMRMAGIDRVSGAERSARTSAKPSIPGTRTSLRTRSGWNVGSETRAAFPSATACTS